MNRSKIRQRLAPTAVLALVLGASVLLPQVAVASHGLATLDGSSFEIDDNANLANDDGAGWTDWADLPNPVDMSGPELRATDLATGQNDNSYKGGVKEDTECPGETTGSIPNNKSDLLTFHVYEEAGTGAGDPGFLNLAWSRVSDPSGTTLMDFEFNQGEVGEGCNVGPNTARTEGDLLIEYAIVQGGARAEITGRFWDDTANVWGSAVDLDDGTECDGGPCAVGTINSTTIQSGVSDGLGTKQPRTFGEAQIDLDLLFDENSCTSFGSAMLKSRSSDAFTSQLKDFISPIPIDLQNCGNVIIHKQTDPDGATDLFGFSKTFATDPTSVDTFKVADDGTMDYEDSVLFGADYTVTEDVIPANWAFDSLDCSASTAGTDYVVDGATVTFDINSDSDKLECTYYNNIGALRILKNSSKGDGTSPVANEGAVFSFDGETVTDGGAADEDADTGEVCVSGLPTGDYTVNETDPPDGYGGASETDQTVTVVAGTNCTDNEPTGAGEVTFTNNPLTDIQVNFRDGGSGETSLTSIDCDNAAGVDTLDGTPATDWDDSVTHEGLEINGDLTVVCTIIIDP